VEVRKRLVLASRSPRRQLLLRQIGLAFDAQESGVGEEFDPALPPEENVRRVAGRKAAAVAQHFDDAIIIGADTTVVLEGAVFNKPRDAADAAMMLRSLSGRMHQVYTGFVLLDRPSGQSLASVEVTNVTFRPLGEAEIADYVRSGSPMDKAGGYGIQDDYGAVFVERIDGCFYNVVGFPLANFYLAMEKFQQQLGL
jgi:septum formation protein